MASSVVDLEVMALRMGMGTGLENATRIRRATLLYPVGLVLSMSG
jgi:hypothetical protein